ncbi:MAG: hypothetical protein R2770_12340 [Acidimicrobiales bacterium]|nr:hypothetical protein [Acidimicrobiales bacterium]
MRCTDRSPRSAGIPSAILALALAVVFVLGGARAAGIAPSSDEFALGDATTATAPKTAVDPITGDRLVVWLDEDGTVSGRIIRGSELAEIQAISTGSAVGGLDVVSTREGYVLTWSDGEVVWARSVGRSGAVAGDPVQVSPDFPASDTVHSVEGVPSMSVDSATGTIAIVWVANADHPTIAGSDAEVFARIVDSGLVALGPAFQVSFTGPDGETDLGYTVADPDVAFDPVRGVFVVVWSAQDLIDQPPEFDHQAWEHQIFSRTFATDGVGDLPSIRVTDVRPTGDGGPAVGSPAVAVGSSGYLVAYSAFDDSVSTTGPQDIFARVFDRDWGAIGDPFAVSTDTADNGDLYAEDPVAAWLPNTGSFVIAWSGSRSSAFDDLFTWGTEWEVRVNTVSDGVAQTPVEVSHLANDDGSDARAPALSAGSGPDLLATWSTGSAQTPAALWLSVDRAPVDGYLMLESSGETHGFGDAVDLSQAATGAEVVDLAMTSTLGGYWTLNSDGSIGEFGDAPEIGDVALESLAPGETVSAISATPTGLGYWVFTDRGRAIVFGDAFDAGGVEHLELDGPVIDSTPTPSGYGYYMLGSDGGVFSLGDARFHGSVPQVLPGVTLDGPVVGVVPTPTGSGYWLVASDGGVFAFGDATFRGSIPQVLPGVDLNEPVNGMVAFGDGYLMVASDGGVFNFSDHPFFGSLGDTETQTPIVAIAAVAG